MLLCIFHGLVSCSGSHAELYIYRYVYIFSDKKQRKLVQTTRQGAQVLCNRECAKGTIFLSWFLLSFVNQIYNILLSMPQQALISFLCNHRITHYRSIFYILTTSALKLLLDIFFTLLPSSLTRASLRQPPFSSLRENISIIPAALSMLFRNRKPC